jgi:hypothetical protein
MSDVIFVISLGGLFTPYTDVVWSTNRFPGVVNLRLDICRFVEFITEL